MKNTYYFPHDYHARHDPKLSALIKTFGMTGYGVYWNFVEILHEQGGRMEKFPKMFEGLAHELSIDEALLKQIISASISDFHLFKEDKSHIWADRVLKNMEEREAKRLQKVEAGRLGGILSGKKRSKTKHRFKQNEANEPKERKGKESKVNKRRGEENTVSLAGLTFKESFIKIKKEIYPTLDIEAEICACVDWHKTNNTKTTKTQQWEKAITNWLKISYGKRGIVKNQKPTAPTYSDPKDSICPKCNSLYAVLKDGSKTCNCPVSKEGVKKVGNIVSGVLKTKEGL